MLFRSSTMYRYPGRRMIDVALVPSKPCVTSNAMNHANVSERNTTTTNNFLFDAEGYSDQWEWRRCQLVNSKILSLSIHYSGSYALPANCSHSSTPCSWIQMVVLRRPFFGLRFRDARTSNALRHSTKKDTKL